MYFSVAKQFEKPNCFVFTHNAFFK